MTMLRKVAQQVAVSIEDTGEAMPRLVYRIMLRGVLQRILHPDVIVDGLDSKRRVSMLHVGVLKATWHCHLGERAVEHVDSPGAEICRIEERHIGGGPNRPVREREALVDCARCAATRRAR